MQEGLLETLHELPSFDKASSAAHAWRKAQGVTRTERDKLAGALSRQRENELEKADSWVPVPERQVEIDRDEARFKTEIPNLRSALAAAERRESVALEEVRAGARAAEAALAEKRRAPPGTFAGQVLDYLGV